MQLLFILVQGVEGGQKAVCNMETDTVTDKLTCYLLFRKFTREVPTILSCLHLFNSVSYSLLSSSSLSSGAGEDEAVQG